LNPKHFIISVLALISSKRAYLLLALAGVAVLLVLTRPDRDPGLQEAIAPQVVVAAVGLHELLPVETVSGRLEPARKTSLHFELSGQVHERVVEPGQTVEQGALLLSLSAGDYQDALAEAAAQLEQESRNIQRDRELLKLSKRNHALQKNDLDRLEKLGADSLVSKSLLDETRIKMIQLEAEIADLDARVGSAKSRLSLKQAARNRAARNLERTQLRAPFAGTVNAVNVQTGDYVTSNQTVVGLVDAARLELYVEVRGDVAQSLAQGRSVDVETNSGILPGKIVALQLDPDPVTFTHALRVRLDGATVRPGQIARARLPLQALHDVTAVPATAVLYDEGRAFVFRHNSGLLEKVEVQAGSRVGDLQVVLQGINATDHVVMRDVAALSDGQTVVAVDVTDAAVQGK
jgi:RND family efflux transporter MFP subunit